MLKQAFVWIIVLLSAAVWSPAQSELPVCGTSGERAEAMLPRFRRNKQAFYDTPRVRPRTITYVPVTFHLAGKDDGTGRVSPGKVMEMLCAANEDFAGMNIQFFIHRLNFIDNSAIYEDHPSADNLMIAQRDPRSINIWLVRDATPENGGNGLILGYYTTNDRLRDWIVMRNSEVSANSTTLSHELGHYFSLLHPFRGWDSEPYDPEIHGTPAPAISPDGIATELMSGANCETAADEICDTPPDYQSGFGWTGCDYQGARDPENVPIDPEERLMMSYFDDCSREEYFFSDMQQVVMIEDLFSTDRNYLRSANTTPNLSPITEAPGLIFPGNTEHLEVYNAINFQWSAVSGADQYLLEIDIAVNFSTPLTQRFLVNGTSLLVTTLAPNRTYYWRIRPFNNYYTCVAFTNSKVFTTGSTPAADNPGTENEWRISPNPAPRNGNLNFFLNASVNLEADIQLFSLSGQLITRIEKKTFRPGQNQLPLPVRHLESSVYLLRIAANGKTTTTRLVVVD